MLGLSGPRQFLPSGHRGAEVRTVPGVEIGWGRSVKSLCGGFRIFMIDNIRKSVEDERQNGNGSPFQS